uniref:Uncharacterized protein n=1 Tax=Leptocylindrus danicus TaxID=163516 RepID=A0A6U2PH21_9STRA|mmetsp:Transcript_25738/g.38508  ORF Transcript_25738/g.38508 Transcript_25738/m.38508 type:complete len:410 (+) Transcript_25738:239-1468(+)|eukprot:CAMPEP_0116017444 /NCGR_PEP_ID=MMETSP0321-20121206/8051_1 /TAXON_ID=163516 /ORGANISM="Leptocylindrus danicus var. danicus, Strain B650" /LENGTH=409 /DNA_ID=CAMNT_0003487637 /DNA_START=159 /DNA_END=1388 /DNA_ORIENTATION=+
MTTVWSSSNQQPSDVPSATLSLQPAQQRQESLAKIDNRHHVYLSYRLRCGVTVFYRSEPNVIERCPTILTDLENDLTIAINTFPSSLHKFVQRTDIYVNCSYIYGPLTSPCKPTNSTAHHDKAWLLWACDKPEKTHCIEIYNCFEYQRTRLHWNGSGIILHELCHLIHQFVLDDGLSNAHVKELYDNAKLSGKYVNVLRRDWAGRDTDRDTAYAMVNHKEFFAEISVAYLCKSFQNLDYMSPAGEMIVVSPPFASPTALAALQMKHGIAATAHLRIHDPLDSDSDSCNDEYHNCKNGSVDFSGESHELTEEKQKYTGIRILEQMVLACFSKKQNDESSANSNSSNTDSAPPLAHCNKFYPFTSGQLASFDPELFAGISHLWDLIAKWEDDESAEEDVRPRDCIDVVFCI